MTWLSTQENPKEWTKDKTKQKTGTNKEVHSKVSGHSVNTQKSVACLYSSNEKFEFQIKKHTFKITSKK